MHRHRPQPPYAKASASILFAVVLLCLPGGCKRSFEVCQTHVDCNGGFCRSGVCEHADASPDVPLSADAPEAGAPEQPVAPAWDVSEDRPPQVAPDVWLPEDETQEDAPELEASPEDSSSEDGEAEAEPFPGVDAEGEALASEVPMASFCEAQPTQGLLLCEDFSGWLYGVETTTGPYNNSQQMKKSVADGAMVLQDPGDFSSIMMRWNGSFDLRDTSFEADVTPSTVSRSAISIAWLDSFNFYNISMGLQLDEQKLYLRMKERSDLPDQIVGIQIEPGKRVHLGLLVRADGEINCLVDNKVVLTTFINLSAFPATGFGPSIGSNAYPPQTFTIDNLVVRKVPAQ